LNAGEKAVARAAHGAAGFIDAAREDRMLLVELFARTSPEAALQLFPVVLDIAAGLANMNPDVWETMKQSFREDVEKALLEDLDPEGNAVD